MASLLVVFYLMLVIFMVIGSGRGWAKEMLVIFGVLVALALISVFEKLIPFTSGLIVEGSLVQFWFRTLIMFALVIFGYQSPKISKFAAATAKRDQIQETMLGMFMGLITGYMVVGSFWSFMDHAQYPFQPFITSPANDPNLGVTAMNLIKWLPPVMPLTQHPWIYVIVIFAFVFVLVVFL